MSKLYTALLALRRFAASRMFALSLLWVFSAGAVLTVSSMASTVYIVDGATTAVAFTTRRSAAEIITAAGGPPPNPHDEISARQVQDNYSEIKIDRAFEVSLTADGNTRTYQKTGGTVYSLLQDAGIEMDSNDLTNLPLDKGLEPGDDIVFHRVEYQTVTEVTPVAFDYQLKSTSLIGKGRTRLLTPGQDGTQVSLYADYIVDGRLHERELISTDIVRQPVHAVTLVGDGSEISTLDFSAHYPLDEKGVPINYLYVLHNQVATGYSGRTGTWGASGMRCFAGTVAVRSSQFPYGTKFYIQTADRGFVYGYAIANDTGTGLVQGVIDVDLFYPTYAESVLNSRRIVDIYVLEVPASSQRYPRASVPASLTFKPSA